MRPCSPLLMAQKAVRQKPADGLAQRLTSHPAESGAIVLEAIHSMDGFRGPLQ